MTGAVLGWDVGGANLKLARLAGVPGSVPQLVERPFALWREPHRLASVIADAAEQMDRVSAMAVTMTGELADCFATKDEGVTFILAAFSTAFPGIHPWVYGVDGHFHSADTARQRPLQVAAANWMASATLVARTFPDAIFIDVGSTTTDIIAIVDGRVAVRGRTDPDRLRSGELVYTGTLRTPVCAMARTVPLAGRRCRVAAELFAIAADVHLWRGAIPESQYACDTPDGRGRSRAEAGARLARMVCADLAMIGAANVTAIADYLADAQVRQITAGLRQVVRRLGADCPRLAVLAGQGTFLAHAAVAPLGLEPRELATEMGADMARSVPAAAVAYLLAERLASQMSPNTGPAAND